MQRKDPVVQVRSGISLVSIENAVLNLKTEITDPFGWDFNAVRQNQLMPGTIFLTGLKLPQRIRLEKVRFYNSYVSLNMQP